MESENNKMDLLTTFSPSRTYLGLLYQYITISFILLILPWMVPVAIFAPLSVFVILAVSICALYIFLYCWARKYFDTISYSLHEDSINWKRGVWFKTTGIVTYNKITNIDIGQGPLSRRRGIASLKLQTAGYSANKSSAEISINGMKEYESLRDIILEHVKGMQGIKSKKALHPDELLLQEVVEIRKLLEKNMGG